MRRGIAIAFAFMAFLWTATPLLACIMPDPAMSAAERECCKHMAQMCGAANMPQSHSCCKKEVRSITMVATNDQQSLPHMRVVAVVAPSVELQFSGSPYESKNHLPPGECLPEPTVLRI